MFCLDTDISVAFLRGNEDAAGKILSLRNSGEICTTFINVCELYKGIFLSEKRDSNIQIVEEFLSKVSLLDSNSISAKIYGQNFSTLRDKGIIVPEMDLLIASICEANDCSLVTRNIKDFKNIAGLICEAW